MVTEGPISLVDSDSDAYESDAGSGFFRAGSYNLQTSSAVSAQRYNGGYHYVVPNIENGDTIDSVDLILSYIGFPSDDTRVDVFANAVDSASDFGAEQDITTRINSAATTASASWIHLGNDSSRSSLTDGIDLNAVVQEVIDRAGWNAGQNMVFLLAGKDDLFSYGYADAWDRTGSGGATVTFTYTVGGGGPVPSNSRRLLSGTGR